MNSELLGANWGQVFSSGQDRSEMGRLRSCGIEIAIKNGLSRMIMPVSYGGAMKT